MESTAPKAKLGEHLQLHVPKLDGIDYDAIREIASEIGESVDDALKWVKSIVHYKEVKFVQEKAATLSEADIQAMLKANIVSETSKKKCFMRVFSVVEKEKNRRRLICHTAAINDQTHCPRVSLLGVSERASFAAKGDYAVTFDFRAYFFQFITASEIADINCFKCLGKWYKFLRLPMGQTQSVFVAHSISVILAKVACHRAALDFGRCCVYIDNVMFVGTLREVEMFKTAFLELCVTVKAVLSESGTVSQQSEFCGLQYNFATHEVRMASKVWRKVQQIDLHTVSTPKEFFKVTGILIFAAQALSVRLCEFYYVLKFASRLASKIYNAKIEASDAITLWPSIVPQLQSWLNIACENKWRTIDCGRKPSILFTDASKFGWGYVLFDEKGVHHHGEKWTETDHINVLEIKAVQNSILHSGSHCTTILLVIDNTTARAALSKGHSPSFAISRAINDVYNTCKERCICIAAVHWIKSSGEPRRCTKPWRTPFTRSASPCRGVVPRLPVKRVHHARITLDSPLLG